MTRHAIRIVAFSTLLVAGYAGDAIAQTVPIAPTKSILIYNNSTANTIYPVLSIGANALPGAINPDLWMQAQFKVNQIFPRTLVYRAYINPDKGIPPQGAVTITVPFYTQLTAVTEQNLGVDNDQFIDWWNGGRVYFFDGPTAVDSSLITYNTRDGPPQPVVSYNGAPLPSCTSASNNGSCEPVSVLSYTIDPPFNIPFQLNEYTFASATGSNSIDLTVVNYNISNVDSAYLPVAMGPVNNSTILYQGTTVSVSEFRAGLQNFTKTGKSWPYYLPVYFSDPKSYPQLPVVDGAACSLSPPSTDTPAYPLPKIPGTYNLLVESYRTPAPTPPVLSSNPAAGPISCVENPAPASPNLGTSGQAMVDLWTKCTASLADSSTTCKNIRKVSDFFKTDYAVTCKFQGSPDTKTMLQQVYGWAQFPDCAAPLKDTTGYADAEDSYCDLQYNYLDTSVPAADIFNPYTPLIHQTLQSTGYAFSIDDKTSFIHAKGDGVIFAIGGPEGLENMEQSPLPDKDTYKSHCGTTD
jgi:hypothetical protein